MAIRTLFSKVLMIAVSRFSLSTFSRTRPKTISSRHPGNLPPKLPCTDTAEFDTTLVPSTLPCLLLLLCPTPWYRHAPL